tara:strand:+ start:1515 stop:1808 length:294 start_codon:yes stop_codon:yes gene_type:complete
MKNLFLTLAVASAFAFSTPEIASEAEVYEYCPENYVNITTVCNPSGSCWTKTVNSILIPGWTYNETPSQDDINTIQSHLNAQCFAGQQPSTTISSGN